MKNYLKVFKRVLVVLTVLSLGLNACPQIRRSQTVQAANIIKLNKTKITMYVGDSTKLKLVGVKSNKVKWKSSNSKIASVSGKGKVVARKKGKVKIVVTYKKKKYRCEITVKNAKASNNKNETIFSLESKKEVQSIIGKTVQTESIVSSTYNTVNTVNNANSVDSDPKIQYMAHVSDIGWQSYKNDGETAGTIGCSKAMEALIIKCTSPDSSNFIKYRAHCQDIGWQSWKSSGEMAGTTGNSKAIEAVQIQIEGSYSELYDVYYRVHIRDFGWLGWAKNGQIAGSTGLSVRTEAIQIKIVKKSDKIELSTGKYNLSPKRITYQAHIQDQGWLQSVGDGSVAGSTGKSKRLEAISIHLRDYEDKSGISYKAHVSDVGWQDWKSCGQIAGTTGQSRAIEAVSMKLSSSLLPFYDLYYRVHSQDYGWLGWAKNGEYAGTVGGGVRAEAIQIKLVIKNQSINRGGTAYYDLTNKWVFPMKNAYCTWNTYKNMSWGNLRNNSSRPYHAGIDIASGSGDSNVYSASRGKVVRVNYTSGNGNYIIIKHTISGETVYSLYSHLSKILCSVNQEIECGEKIGVYGSTGNSTGPHLHFAIFKGFTDDPVGYISKLSGNVGYYNGVTFYNPQYVIENGVLPRN